MIEWREVPGIPHFLVTSGGRVKAKAFTNESALNRWGNICTRNYRERELSPVLISPPGYMKVAALRLKNRPRYYVHRLVALAFVNGFEEGKQVNHKNGNKTDNRAANLEWVTSAENIRHAWDSGLHSHGINERHHGSKLTGLQVVAIREAGSLGISGALLARITGLSTPGILSILNNKRWVDIKE